MGNILADMDADKPIEERKETAKKKANSTRERDRPEWTNGLRQLYDAVVDEPIPDSFKDLLSRLDSKS